MCYIGIVYRVRQQNKKLRVAKQKEKLDKIRSQNKRNLITPPNSPIPCKKILSSLEVDVTLDPSSLAVAPWSLKYLSKNRSINDIPLSSSGKTTSLKITIDKKPQIEQNLEKLNNIENLGGNGMESEKTSSIPTLSILVEESTKPDDITTQDDIVHVEVHKEEERNFDLDTEADKSWNAMDNSEDLSEGKDYLKLPSVWISSARRRRNSSMSSSTSICDSSICDSISLFSYNTTDDVSLNGDPLSREITPPNCIPSSPTPLSPLPNFSQMQMLPQIVITVTEEESRQAEQDVCKKEEQNENVTSPMESRSRIDSELSTENTASPESSSEMNTIENVFFSDEEYETYLDKISPDKTTNEDHAEIEQEISNEIEKQGMNHLDTQTDLHKCSSESNLSLKGFKEERSFSFRSKKVEQLSKRRGSIFSQLSSRLAIHDTNGNIHIYNKQCEPKSFNASVKGALFLRLSKARMRNRQRSEVKTAQKSSYIVLLFILLWLPLPIAVALTLYYVNHGNEHEKVQMMLDFQVCAFCFGTLSATANPVIYGLAIKKFRRAFFKLTELHRQRIAKRWNRTF